MFIFGEKGNGEDGNPDSLSDPKPFEFGIGDDAKKPGEEAGRKGESRGASKSCAREVGVGPQTKFSFAFFPNGD